MTHMGEPFILSPSSLISPIDGPRRVPPRVLELQEPDYIEKYDASTVFYDVFLCGQKVLAIGPPAGSLADEIRSAKLTSGMQRSSRFSVESGLDRVGRFWASPHRGAGHGDLSVVSPLSPSPVKWLLH